MKVKKQILLFFILLLAVILRIWKLDTVPVSLFGDELDVGYQAYSILKTGKDYSGNFLPIHLKSLAEYRTPLYAYSAIPTIGIFGISPLGVRLPNAIFGVLAVLGIYFLVKEITGNKILSLIAAFLLCISPWHLHFSRTGFDGPQMITLYIFGIYFLIRSFKGKNTLWLSAVCLAFTPWSYSTAKLFLPVTIIAFLIIWKDNFKKISQPRLIWAVIIFLVISIPFVISTFFGGGSERIQGVSILNDPTVPGQMGFDRLNDAMVRDQNAPSINTVDKLFHNKVTAYFEIFINNYLQAFSTDFLFIRGDYLNPRHSSGIELYTIEALFLLLGLFFLLKSQLDKRIKFFLIFWVLFSPVPSSITQGGGTHATRLLLMLPILTILIAFGMYYSYLAINRSLKIPYLLLLSISLLLGFVFYQHNYWIHYPWSSEKWWHGGFKEAIQAAVSEGSKYDRVIISGADEPPLIFFLAWSQYSPRSFQKNYPLKKQTLEAFGEVSILDNYLFPSIGLGKSLYELGAALPKNSLYLATAKEINLDLIKEPGRLPSDLTLIRAITYPSGAPAFYLFTKNESFKKL